MNVEMTDSVRFGLETLRPEQRASVERHLTALAHWESDPSIRKMTRPISIKNTFVVEAPDGFWIFFEKKANKFVVQEIARKELIEMFAQ